MSTPGTTRSAASVRDPMGAIELKRALALGEQAAFLWASRSVVTRSSAVRFDALVQLDERLSRVVYKLSERPALAEALSHHNHAALKSGLAFVTAVVSLRGGVAAVLDELLARLQSDPQLLSPLASALSWLEYGEVRPYIDRLLLHPSPTLLHLGVLAAVAHHVDPGVALDRAMATKVPALRGTALEAVGRLGRRVRDTRLQEALDDEDATCRFWAAWSAVRLGERAGIPVLGRFAADGGAFATAACDMALRALDTAQAVRAQQRLLSITDHKRLGVVAAGIVGDPTLANSLLDAMEATELAPRAAAAFSLMTGCDLWRDDVDGQRGSRVAPRHARREGALDSSTIAEPLADAHDDLVEDDDDEHLAWPDTQRIRRWWEHHRQSFVPGVRYLAGLPIQPAEMVRVLRFGNQHQRAAAALELALLYPDAPLLDVTAPAHSQVRTSERFFRG